MFVLIRLHAVGVELCTAVGDKTLRGDKYDNNLSAMDAGEGGGMVVICGSSNRTASRVFNHSDDIKIVFIGLGQG